MRRKIKEKKEQRMREQLPLSMALKSTQDKKKEQFGLKTEQH